MPDLRAPEGRYPHPYGWRVILKHLPTCVSGLRATSLPRFRRAGKPPTSIPPTLGFASSPQSQDVWETTPSPTWRLPTVLTICPAASPGRLRFSTRWWPKAFPYCGLCAFDCDPQQPLRIFVILRDDTPEPCSSSRRRMMWPAPKERPGFHSEAESGPGAGRHWPGRLPPARRPWHFGGVRQYVCFSGQTLSSRFLVARMTICFANTGTLPQGASSPSKKVTRLPKPTSAILPALLRNVTMVGFPPAVSASIAQRVVAKARG